MSDIIIIGGGLIGIDIARRYRSQTIGKRRIYIKEAAKTLLNGWLHRTIEGYKVDNGFHGIELPRGNKVKDILYELSNKKYYKEIDNERYLMIQDNILSFKSRIADWPLKLKQGLEEKLAKTKDIGSLEKDAQIKLLSGSTIKNLCDSVCERYADDIEDCWNLLYPWFYPVEFQFSTKDEGAKFQRDVRSGLIKTRYLKPIGNLFSDISLTVEKQLNTMEIKVEKEVQIGLNEIKNMQDNGSNTIIWTASSYSLLKMLEPKLAEECIGGIRHMHLYLFEISEQEIKKIEESIGCTPTEVLCLNKKIKEVNRLSFTVVSKDNEPNVKKIAILAEIFSKKRDIDESVPERLIDVLNGQFNIYAKYIGSTYGRPMISLKQNKLEIAKRIVDKYAKENRLIIPEIYFSPINMAKCAKISSEFKLI